MNILIPYSWLKQYVKTDLSAKEFAQTISLYGPSIERWHQTSDGDVVFDVEVTTNRIDAFCVYGLAREAYAILRNIDQKAEFEPSNHQEIINGSGVNFELYADVDQSLCPRFTAVVIDGVEIGKSPAILAERLEKVGERSVNNVVDITNYVMWELGQPMHVFDYDKIAGHKMTLRTSRAGEKLVTLDKQERKIPEGAIVIEDAEKLIDLAGIMGGLNSAVDENTRRVLLFVQTYNPHIIRKTTMQMAFRSHAASRFEKDLDEEAVMPALAHGASLLIAHAGGIVASDVYDIYPNPITLPEVSVSLPQLQTTIGAPISSANTAKTLELLGFDVTMADETIRVAVPSYRARDITIPEDVIEEVARMYGYHNIPSVLPAGTMPNRPQDMRDSVTRTTKLALTHWGFTEVYTNSASSRENIEKLVRTVTDHVTIKNPLIEDFVYLRTHLLETLTPVVAENLPRFSDLKIFELSKVYHLAKEGLPKEITMLQLACANTDILVVKGTIEALLDQLHIADVTCEPNDSSTLYQPGTTGIFIHNKKEIGHIGMLAPTITENFGITQPVVVAKLFFDDIVALASDTVTFSPIPLYPPLIEDLSVVVSTETSVGPLIAAVIRAANLITTVDLIDTYTGDRVGEGNKSITLRLTYQSPTKLLSDTSIAPSRKKITTLLATNFGAKIRL